MKVKILDKITKDTLSTDSLIPSAIKMNTCACLTEKKIDLKYNNYKDVL